MCQVSRGDIIPKGVWFPFIKMSDGEGIYISIFSVYIYVALSGYYFVPSNLHTLYPSSLFCQMDFIQRHHAEMDAIRSGCDKNERP